LSIWLNELGAKVVGYSLDPYTKKDNFVLSNLSKKIIDIRGDIRDKKKLKEVFSKYNPEIVFHLAAQSLVRLSYEIPFETYEINVMGTINIMEEIRKCENTKIGIMITTDKCYENKEQIWGYRENEAMGGHDPYSSSKGAAEIAISSWRKSFFNPSNFEKHGKAIATVRAGNVVGGGDWSKDRIIPDCIRALESNKNIEIRNPKAIRPWQHVLDPLYGYLLLGKKMSEDPKKYSEAWNFGPNIYSIIPVWDIGEKIIKNWGYGNLEDISAKDSPHESKLLSLDISKAMFELGWKPILDIDESLKLTVEWYKNYKIRDVYELCVNQIDYFVRKVKNLS
jgi:CDP-glucose 4,6-dehydratase